MDEVPSSGIGSGGGAALPAVIKHYMALGSAKGSAAWEHGALLGSLFINANTTLTWDSPSVIIADISGGTVDVTLPTQDPSGRNKAFLFIVINNSAGASLNIQSTDSMILADGSNLTILSLSNIGDIAEVRYLENTGTEAA